MQLLALLALTLSAHAFTLKEFHPTGHVKSPRQARAVFSEAIVPFGDPRGIEPFDVKCNTKGKGLWEDSRTWIYEFEQELEAGNDCVFTPKNALKSVSGGAWENPAERRFTTGGPSVLSSNPYDGGQIEEEQAFLLRLDGAVDAGSVEKNAYLLVEGMAERIPLKILDQKTAEKMRKQDWTLRRQKDAHFLAVETARPLPSGKRVQFVWGKGIRAKSGGVLERDQFLAFRTREPFRATFSCERENPSMPCIPISDMSLSFNAPISRKEAEAVSLRYGGKSARPILPKEDTGELAHLSFKGPFPQSTKMEIHLPRGIKDDAGRSLANADKFPLEIATAAYPPLAKFSAPFGIIEIADPVLPVTVRNVEGKMQAANLGGAHARARDPADVIRLLGAVTSRHDSYISWENNTHRDLRGESLLAKEKNLTRFELPKPNGREAFEVMGIPLKETGFHLVEIESPALGASLLPSRSPMFVAAGALVTDLAVHAKWGKENSLFWVTSLATGKPVSGAEVQVTDCDGKQLWSGKSGGDGTVYAEGLSEPEKAKRCGGENGYSRYNSGLYAFAEKSDDISFVHSSWDDGIETWRFQLHGGSQDGAIAHTVLDRSLFRAGERVHMKHFLREGFLRGIRYKKSAMPKHLVVAHSTGQRFVLPLQFTANGIAESLWNIPKGAKLGNYSVYLVTKDIKAKTNPVESDEDSTYDSLWGQGTYRTADFRVEEFRLPVMIGSVQWPRGAQVASQEIPADLAVRYLAGGGASGLSVRVRSRAEKFPNLSFPAFSEFTFANGGVFFGRKARNYSYEEEEEGYDWSKDVVNLPEQKLTLDQNGTGQAVVKEIPQWDLPLQVLLEAEYKDPSGEIQTLSRRTSVYPTKAMVGIKPEGWVATKDKVKFQVAVADAEGRPAPGRKVRVDWAERKSYSHRKRIVGGFYAYENFEETKPLGSACSGSSDEKGLVFCEGAAPASGNLILVAELEEGGRKSRAHRDVWVASGEDWWFEVSDNDRIDLLPERKKYEPGETARLQVRMPFRAATVLLTTEREGVAKHFVREIDAKNPVVEIPIDSEYAPNIFVSALVVRGRVGDPKPTALVDLARPAHKLGIAELQVGWKAHELLVQVETDKEEYQVRGNAKVKVKVTRSQDGKAASDGEILLVAVDEALLELRPNESWKLLEAMMGKRGLRVVTSTAQSQVVGKRHYGLKALPAGGGGGQSSTRELFDTLLYWKASLKLDKNGEAEAVVPLNDSLTSFRLVAVAGEGPQRFGTGSRVIRSTQELMLFSGLAPLARAGDETNPELTVRNSGKEARTVKVSAKVDGRDSLPAQTIELAPGASKTVSWKFQIPKDASRLSYEFMAESGGAKDALKVAQQVKPPLDESTVQATLERVDQRLTVPVEIPKGAAEGRLGVRLERSLASGLGAVKRYMELYPYTCLEQKVSKSVALRNKEVWEGIMKELPAYVSSSGLLKYFPECPCASDTLTSYVLTVAHESGYQIPGELLPKIVGGLKNFVLGKDYYAGLVYPAADLSIRKLAAMEALSRYGAFDAVWLSLIHLEPELWPVGAVIDWLNLLEREQQIPERPKRLAEAEQILRARIEWRGTVVGFKNEMNLWWLMGSGDRDANRLLLSASGNPRWENEIGRLVRGTLARQKRGVWDLTTANAWGVLAMERFSERHEREAVTGETVVKLDGDKKEISWSGEGKRQETQFPWPKGKAELSVDHKGDGKPWALLEARAAIPLQEPIFKGYRFQRKITALEQRRSGKWSVGDTYRVTLEIDAPADMMWVVVSDPIPAGATILGSGLGRDSAIASSGEKEKGGYWWYAHEERTFEGFRKYYEWVPKGKIQLEYTVRLNAAGKFQLPNTRVSAMYAPEMYGEAPNAAVTVQP